MDKHKKYLIIYHKEDNDGVFSAAIFYDYIVNVLNDNLEDICFIGADYNELAQFAKENTVEDLHKDFDNIIITDISFNDVKYMKAIWKEFKNNFIWCDHHAPIIKASFENHFNDTPGIRDTQRSAILNVWKFLYDQFDEAYNAKKVPEYLRILSAYDSWTYEKEGYDFDYVRNVNKGTTDTVNLELGKAKEIVETLRKVYIDVEPYKNMSGQFKDQPLIDSMYERGKVLNDYDDKVMENIIKTSGDCSWQIRIEDKDRGRPLFLNACAIFHQGATNSTMFKSLKNRIVSQGIVFKHQPNGNWVMSLYNVNDDEWLHCGEFLKERYKGGGHKGAAGCTLSQAQFIKILKEKII